MNSDQGREDQEYNLDLPAKSLTSSSLAGQACSVCASNHTRNFGS